MYRERERDEKRRIFYTLKEEEKTRVFKVKFQLKKKRDFLIILH
jgi:hypothetical protein